MIIGRLFRASVRKRSFESRRRNTDCDKDSTTFPTLYEGASRCPRFIAPQISHSSHRVLRCLSDQSKEYVLLYLLFCPRLPRCPNHLQLSEAMTRLKYAAADAPRELSTDGPTTDAAAGSRPRPLNRFGYALV